MASFLYSDLSGIRAAGDQLQKLKRSTICAIEDYIAAKTCENNIVTYETLEDFIRTTDLSRFNEEFAEFKDTVEHLESTVQDLWRANGALSRNLHNTQQLILLLLQNKVKHIEVTGDTAVVKLKPRDKDKLDNAGSFPNNVIVREKVS